MQILQAYLESIKDIKESDNEHTYRTPLENLLKALAEKHKNVKIIHEQSSAEFKASSTGASAEFKGKQKSLGRPDFTVLEGSLTLGYIENKRVNENLQALIDEANKDENAQIARYLKLQDNLILTDYLNFWRVKKDEKGKILAPQKLALCTLNENTDSKLHTLKTLTNPKSLKHQDTQEALNVKEVELLNFFNLFFSSTPKPISTAKDFAAALVVPTKFIRDELIELKDNERIKDLYETFHKGLYDELSFDDFADNFAQTLVYSLFLAKFHKDTASNSASSHTQNYTSHINSNTNATKSNSNASNSSSNHTQGYSNSSSSHTNSNTNSTQGYSSTTNSASSYNTPITLNNVTDFIPNSFELLNSFSDTLKVLNRFEGLRWILDHILALMNHISTADLLLEFSKHSKDLDLFDEKIHANPAIHFYENFISHYNKILRKDKGIYYTPEPIVSFIINAVNLCLKQDLGFERGLQTATKNDEIKLLDFATGTGAFLLEAFYQAFESNKALKDKPASYYDDLRRLIANFRAFELLIAPYAIAHLNLSIALKNSFDYALKDDERLNIFLTNTLEDKVSEVATLFGSKQESKGVKETKQNFKILIITGNPPYNATSQNKFDYTYKPKDKDEKRLSKIQAHYYYCGTKPKEQNPKEIIPIYLDEKNPKWLQDDYVKFIRFAESKIERQEKGIIAIITNNAFLDNPTFRGMRWHLLNNFDKIYILDLHGNTRKKELCPDGSKDENVFDIMQGVSINIFVKTNAKNKPTPAQINETKPPMIFWKSYSNAPECKLFHYDLYGKRKEKYNFLKKNDLNSVEFKELKPKAPFYLFIPQNDELRELYDKFWSVKDIFGVCSVGIVTGKDSVLIATNAEKLKIQVQNFYKEFDEKFVKDISYRPFDTQKIYYDTNKVERPRNEVMQHFLDCENVGLICDRGCSLQKIDNFFIANNIIDKHLIGGNSYLFPLYLKTQNSQKEKTAQKPPFIATNTPPQTPPARGGAYLDTSLASVDTKSPPPLRRGVWGVGEKTQTNNETPKTQKNSANTLNSKENSQISQDKGVENSNNAINTHPQTPSAREGAYLSDTAQQGALSLDNATSQDEGALMVENLTPKFREFIDKKYKQKFSPEQILGYIYAVLYHKTYREKFLDFLKIDYPKIPFVASKESFLALSKLGQELVNLHLMKADLNDEGLNGVGVAIDNGDDKIISKIAYNADSKEIFVNESLHFKGVERAVWEYKIGGYQVLDKYLKSHKATGKAKTKDKEKLDYAHFERIIKTLHKSLEIEKQIAKIELES